MFNKKSFMFKRLGEGITVRTLSLMKFYVPLLMRILRIYIHSVNMIKLKVCGARFIRINNKTAYPSIRLKVDRAQNLFGPPDERFRGNDD